MRDTSGGALPGVTVEATSSALIEGTRTAVTDGQGLYTFVEDFPRVQEVIALYATTPEDVEKLLEKVDPIFPRDQVQIMQFGPSIGAHLGPGAMGVAVFEGID